MEESSEDFSTFRQENPPKRPKSTVQKALLAENKPPNTSTLNINPIISCKVVANRGIKRSRIFERKEKRVGSRERKVF